MENMYKNGKLVSSTLVSLTAEYTYFKQCWRWDMRKKEKNKVSLVISCPRRGNINISITVRPFTYTIRYASIQGKIDWLVAVAQHHPARSLCGNVISLSATLAQMSRGILRSSIVTIDVLFIIFNCKIGEYAHILSANFSQAPRI